MLDIRNLHTEFHTRNGVVRAVQDVSFQVAPGETVGLVGESGSGKSVTCYSLLRLLPQPPARIAGGQALFHGIDLLSCPERQLRSIRGKRIAMIFQDPMTSLNPYLRVEEQLIEPLLIHEGLRRRDARRRAIQALEEVGMPAAEERIRCYPHEFSGGMRQRVMIAMALMTRPELLIADEPTTALDVTVQAQILDVIRQRQRELGTSVIFISHDLGVVAGFCRRVLVMYAGRIVESAPTDALFGRPQHPYNRALQRSIPALQPKGEPLYTIRGMPPDLSRELPGCPFAPRCDYAEDQCRQRPVRLRELDAGHHSACLRVQENQIAL
jgi:oligopeptide transport system ATP-binding protein